MVAYSFKKQFVAPIREGLLVPPMRATLYPKRQTIRAGRKRHARPGEELQLYCGMRTKGCFLIGRARCVSAEPIELCWGAVHATVHFESGGRRLTNEFARADGFKNIDDMRRFWEAEHPDVDTFRGVLVRWEPLT